jgi:hypothetical protein
MRKIKLVCLLLAALAAPLVSHAQNRRGGEGRGGDARPAEGRATTVRAILINVSKGGATDRQLAPYEAILRSYFPSESFHFAAESSASVSPGGKATLTLQGQHLELQSEGGTVFVRTGKGGASLSPGGPGAVFVVAAGSAIIVVAR